MLPDLLKLQWLLSFWITELGKYSLGSPWQPWEHYPLKGNSFKWLLRFYTLEPMMGWVLQFLRCHESIWNIEDLYYTHVTEKI